jgi:hypothetical protein
MKYFLIGLVALAVVGVLGPPAQAVVLSPGGSSSIFGTAAPSGTIQFTQTLTFDVISNNGLSELNGSLTATVIKEAGGTLDFLYQVTNLGATSSSRTGVSIHRVTVSDFTGFTTDVDFVTGTGQAPGSADRSSTGSTVGFGSSGSPLNFSIAPGQTSAVLYVRTNATSFDDNGNTAIIDSLSANLKTPEPIGGGGGVPEPGTLILLGGSLLGLAGWHGFRRLIGRKA